MVGWLAFTVTVDRWFNCGLVWEKEGECIFVCFHVCLCLFVCVCLNERTRGGDIRYLRPTDRHLALRQPSNTRPYGVLRNVTSWHCQYIVCVCVCVFVCLHLCLCTTSNSSERDCWYFVRNVSLSHCVHENYVKYTAAALWPVSFFLLFTDTTADPHKQIDTQNPTTTQKLSADTPYWQQWKTPLILTTGVCVCVFPQKSFCAVFLCK